MQNEHTTNSNESQAPIIAHADDIDREFAERAFTNTSHFSERRGERERKEYADAVNGLYAELWPLAKTDAQRELLATEMERYRQGYLERKKAYLASHANVASAFIVGPARFPVARMEKRGQWADNKANELLAWDRKAQEAIKRKLLDLRPQEEKDAGEWRALERDIKGSLQCIKRIDAGMSPYTRSAFVNSIAGKVERLANAGEAELVGKALALVRSYNERHAKPAISPRHGFWGYEELARKMAAERQEAAGSGPDVLASGGGVSIVARPDIDRVQILFDEKPPAPMIAALKSEAWKWSPREGAWQRKLTEASKHSAKRIAGI